MAERTHLVFVYGSLKEGFHNNCVLDGSPKIAEGITHDARFLMHSMGGFPAIYRDIGEQAIWGEVYEVDEESLERCDRLEGHPRLYQRMLFPIMTCEGEVLEAWVYTMGPKDFGMYVTKGPNSPRIEKMNIDGIEVVNWLPPGRKGKR